MKRLLSGVVGLFLIANVVNAQSLSWSNSREQELLANLTDKQELKPHLLTGVIQPGDFDDPMRSKTFSKSYPLNKSDKVILSNQYGAMVIKIWDKNEVKLDAEIKVYSGNGDDAQKLLDEVNIASGSSENQVVFKTSLGQKGGNWGSGSRNGKKWRREVRVNYVVYMPAANSLTLSQTYGNVTMGDLNGALYAKVQYGDFSAANLNSTNNYISVHYGKANIGTINKAVIIQQYGSGLTVGTITELDLDAQYAGVNISNIKGNAKIKQQYGSGLLIGTVENADLDVQYADVKINTIKGDAKIKQQYSNLVLASVAKLTLNAQYTNVSIGTLRGDGNFSMEYNNLNIDEVGIGCKIFNIRSAYLETSIGFSNIYNADLEVNTSYGSFKYGERVAVKATGESNTNNYRGKIGNGGTAKVKISSSYGAIKFK